MSSYLLIFISENIQFDFHSIIQTISHMDNIYNFSLDERYLMQDSSLGSLLECEYRYHDDDFAIVKLANSLKFIATESTSKASIDFSLKLQNLIDVPLTVTDNTYSFLIKLKKINSIEEFEQLMISEVYME